MNSVTRRTAKIIHTRFSTISKKDLYRAFNRARRDLYKVGLLDDGRYLDRIGYTQSMVPTFSSELGYVFDRGVAWRYRALGYRPGIIYVPLNPPVESVVPGNTLLDTIRHEFAHAWAWLDPKFIDLPWFQRAFGACYDDAWAEAPEYDRADFVSRYACTAPKEDFAETFMVFLRRHDSLDRYLGRPGMYHKLKAVERAVARAARERAHRVRGPR